MSHANHARSGTELTQCLNVVLIEAALHVFDHETRLAYLRIADHADFDDNAAAAP